MGNKGRKQEAGGCLISARISGQGVLSPIPFQ